MARVEKKKKFLGAMNVVSDFRMERVLTETEEGHTKKRDSHANSLISIKWRGKKKSTTTFIPFIKSVYTFHLRRA